MHKILLFFPYLLGTIIVIYLGVAFCYYVRKSKSQYDLRTLRLVAAIPSAVGSVRNQPLQHQLNLTTNTVLHILIGLLLISSIIYAITRVYYITKIYQVETSNKVWSFSECKTLGMISRLSSFFFSWLAQLFLLWRALQLHIYSTFSTKKQRYACLLLVLLVLIMVVAIFICVVIYEKGFEVIKDGKICNFSPEKKTFILIELVVILLVCCSSFYLFLHPLLMGRAVVASIKSNTTNNANLVVAQEIINTIDLYMKRICFAGIFGEILLLLSFAINLTKISLFKYKYGTFFMGIILFLLLPFLTFADWKRRLLPFCPSFFRPQTQNPSLDKVEVEILEPTPLSSDTKGNSPN